MANPCRGRVEAAARAGADLSPGRRARRFDITIIPVILRRMEDPSHHAAALAALGHEARLAVFRLLVRAGPEGVGVGALVSHMGLPASSLAHHLRALVAAGLVTQERRGRQVVNRADFEAMHRTLGFLTAECCAGVALVREDAA